MNKEVQAHHTYLALSIISLIFAGIMADVGLKGTAIAFGLVSCVFLAACVASASHQYQS